MDPNEAFAGAAGKFPFVMVMASAFLDGCFFIVFNIPLITNYLGGSSFSGVNDLLVVGIVPIWSKTVDSVDGVALVTLFILLSILAGIFITPVSRSVSFAGAKLLEAILRLLRKWVDTRTLKIFSSADFLSPKNAELLAWFMGHPAKKIHWEWELFGYYVYWGAFLNVSIFATISLLLLWNEVTLLVVASFALVTLLFFLYALTRTKAMGEVHTFYLNQFGKNT